ncbi:MAG: ROK family protein [Candidatus Portnoybacteria bacterium]|nr:ROK family protein [Candidatus Portnoybacteria bacterium]
MYLLFDIGGTNIRLGFSHDGICIDKKETFSRPKDSKEAMGAIRLFCKKSLENQPLKTAVGGIAGVLDAKKETLLVSPNMKEWEGMNVKKALQKGLKTNVLLENDADLAGLGEAVYGQGKEQSIVAYLAVGTGVGGTRIVNKTIDKNAWGFEPGHQIIEINGKKCLCGGKGHLESYISGGAIERELGKKPYEITDEQFWDEKAKLLALGLHNTIVYWSPDVVILGGSMMKEIGIPIERVTYHLKKIMKIFPELPPIKKAALEDEAGLWGGLAYTNQKLKAKSYERLSFL